MEAKIVGKECQHVTHLTHYKKDDYCIVKELIHYEDGSIKRNLRILKNFERPFWITKKIYRTYKDKRETESLSRVDKFMSTERNLGPAIAGKLGMFNPDGRAYKDVAVSPYVYGADFTVGSYIKYIYEQRYPNFNTPLSTGALDIEADVDTGVMSLISVISTETGFLAVNRDLVKGIKDPIEKIKQTYKEKIKSGQILLDVPVEIKIFDTEIEMLIYVFSGLHSLKLDAVLIWNMQYDIPKIMDICKASKYRPEDLFSDPSIPVPLRYFKWNKGPTSTVKESGEYSPISHEYQWDTVKTPSSHMFIDAMRNYVQMRGGKNSKKIPGGVNLDNILKINNIPSKLSFGPELKYFRADRHRFMVSKMPIEYCVYNIADNTQVLSLEAKTKDVSLKLPTNLGLTPLEKITSNPRKLIDRFFIFTQKLGRVPGVRDPKLVDDKILGLEDWISTLKTSLVTTEGLNVIKDIPELNTNIRAQTLDLDAVASYPSDTVASNLSKDTTSKELVKVEGFERLDFMYQNMSLIYGRVGSPNYATTVFKKPTILELFKKIKN